MTYLAINRHWNAWKRLGLIFTCLWMLQALVPVLALPPPADTVIRNQASATYFNTALNQTETVRSPVVEATIAPVTGFDLVPSQEVFSNPGVLNNFSHTLRNTGNTAVNVVLNLRSRVNDDYNLLSPEVVLDQNLNGLADEGEPRYANGASIPLAYGQELRLIVQGVVPSGVTDNQRSVTELTASQGATTVTVTDTVVVRLSAAVQLTKRISNNTPTAGDVVRYTLIALNTSSLPLPTTSVTVDGNAVQTILLRDDLPANVQYAGLAFAGVGRVLYHVVGNPRHTYQSAAPVDLSTVDALAFAYNSFPANFRTEPYFEVRINSNASGAIVNVAEAYPAGLAQPMRSNPVEVQLPERPAQLIYTRTGVSIDPVTLSPIAQPLNLRAEAAVCNADPAVTEVYEVTLEALLSGDRETQFTLRETGPNTGIFILAEIPTAMWPVNRSVNNDGVIQQGMNDTVNATLICGGTTLRTAILIDPSGIVFNARTNQPVAGATVTLVRVDAAGNILGPATVLDFNGRPVPNTQVTNANGMFQFPLVPADLYRILVTPPNGLSFPSTVLPAALDPSRRIENASYGRPFPVSVNTGAVVFDVPLDPAAVGGLALDKKANSPQARTGESLRYTLTLTNNTGLTLNQLRVDDTLPNGLTYVAGSAQLDGQPLADPVGGIGPNLRFALPVMLAAQRRELTYLARVGLNVREVSFTNRAQAFSVEATSNRAEVTVALDRGVFHDEGIIMGKVFVDCNRNRQQDPQELGIPGVRLLMEDGRFAVTDAEGKYNLYGVSPKTHVLKVDPISLPQGIELQTMTNRNGGDPYSQFIDIKRGELFRADYSDNACTPEILALVKARREKGEVFTSEINRRQDRLDVDALQFDPRDRPAQGVVQSDGTLAPYKPILFDAPQAKFKPRNGAPSPTTSINLETLLQQPDVTNALAFMDVKDGDTLPTRDLTLRVKGRRGYVFRLTVNDAVISETRVGQKAVMESRDLEAWEYIALRLKAGTNVFLLEALDPFGNLREKTTLSLVAPDDLGQLRWVIPSKAPMADGQTPVLLTLKLMDSKGILVTARTPVTLETSNGRWDAVDLDEKEPGLQIFVEGGQANIALIPPQEPGDARLRATSGLLKTDHLMAFSPYLRPLVATGLVEGVLGLSRLKGDQVTPVTPLDTFEEDIRSLNDQQGDASGAMRGALYLKGKVKGDVLLTLAYDSDRGQRDRLFRDIDPDSFYPVYGDSSVRGFDAQSTSRLYVRVDKGRSSVLYGDFNTGNQFMIDGGQAVQQQGGASDRRLSQLNRTLTGVRAHVENGSVSSTAYASYDNRRQGVVEFQGQGVSGPYPLNSGEIVLNSEKVEIQVRDRNQPAVILKTTPLARFADYTLNELVGSILFNRPIPSLDENFNPIFIRVTFESQGSGDRTWVYGGQVNAKVGERVEVGVSAARDQVNGNNYQLYGATGAVKLGDNGYVVVEGARSNTAGVTGNAARVEVVQRSNNVDVSAFAARTEAEFVNPNALQSSGRTEAGVKGQYRINDQTRLGIDGLYSADDNQSQYRVGVLAYGEHAFNQQLNAELGMRYIDGTAVNTTVGSIRQPQEDLTSIRAKLTYRPEWWRQGSVFGEYEQSIQDPDLRLAAVGGEMGLGQKGRMYARHEFLTSLSGAFALGTSGANQNNTVVGIDFNYLENAAVFSEYRVRDALSGNAAEAAMGLRNRWNVGAFRLATALERVQPINGIGQENTAVSVSGEYLASELTKATGRIEARQSPSERAFLTTMAVAHKMSLDWTFLGRNTLSVTTRRDATQNRLIRDRFRTGFAYRDTDTNRWMWLGRYETRYDRDDTTGEVRTAHVVSTHANYQPVRPWIFSGRIAGKYVTERFGNLRNNSTAFLVGGRARYDLTDRIDLGLMTQVLADRGFDHQQYALGLEAGYLMASNLWVSGGYNFTGFSDQDLAQGDFTEQGAYARMRFKFDEDFLEWME